MKYAKSFKLIAALMALTLAILACGGGTTPTTVPTAAPITEAPTTEAPTTEASTKAAVASGDVEIVSLSTYKDTSGYFHVVGEIHNGTAKALTSIELTIKIKDAGGKSLLKDDSDKVVDSLTFSPLVSTLGPDESSPFDYYLSSDAGTPADKDCCQVTVTGQETGQVNRADVQVENGEMTTDSDGNIHLTGELVNKGSSPAQLNSLAGAALDADGKVVAANWSTTVTRYLAPTGDSGGRDRTPFHINLDGKVDNVKDQKIFIDADQAQPAAATNMKVEIVRGYFDGTGSYHLIGLLTNNGKDTMNVSVVGGLYAKDGTVLDADTFSVPIYLEAGQTIPYDLAYFGSVSKNADEGKRIDSYTVQVDPYWTYPSTSQVVALKTSSDDGGNVADGNWTLKGDVTNTSGQALSSITVLTGLYDAGGKLVASGWTSISPAEGKDSLAKGEKGSFELTIYLDSQLDTTGLKFKTFVQGSVKS